MEKKLLAPMIINAVCDVCGITAEELTNQSRKRHITDARKMVAYLLLESKTCTRMSEISPLVGLCRNSIYQTIEGFGELLKYDCSFRARFQRVCLILENRQLNLRVA